MKLNRILLALGIGGLGCLVYSLTLPYYTDGNAMNSINDMFVENKIDKSLYYEKAEQLKTNKIVLMDLGTGILITSLILFIFLYISKVQYFSDLKNINACGKIKLFVLVNVAGIIMIPGTIWYYIFRLYRGDYPPFSDSILIPIMTEIPMFLVGLIFLNIVLALLSFKSHTLARLFAVAKQYTIRAILLEIFFGFWFILVLLFLISDIINGDHFSIPVFFVYLYAFLVVRAGRVSR